MKLMLLGLLFCLNASASVTLPYTYGSNVPPSQANANDQALRDEINAHEAAHNAHNTSLSDILSVGSTVGAYSINFNGKELFNALVEKVTVDPTCSTASTVKGRLIFNTIDGLLKFCDGSSFISIAGTGVNTLSSVLSAGNSAGSSNINLNLHQLLNTRLENLGSDPSAASAGRIWWNTVDQAFRLDTGSSILTLGGSQGLSSVLGVSNSAGSTSLNMNGNQILNFKIDMLASAPSAAEARVYYDTTAHKLKFYNGSSWLEIGNTNTLAQAMALGNSVGSNDLNLNSRQILNARLENTASPPGTGSAGRIWYDTGSDQIQFETAGASNRTVATLDNAQTLTNKTISGSSNTITNIQDSSLSANACLLNANQTVSGTKTFSASPIVSSLKTPSGAVHTLTDGLGNDTFTLNNAVQTLTGKTLQSPTLSGNLDAAYYQATHFRLENLSSTPASGHAGRMIYKTSTGEVQYDTGTSWLTFQSNNPSASGWSVAGNSALDSTVNFLGTTDAVDVVMKANGSEILRLVSGGGIKTQLGSGLVKSSSGTLALAASGTDYAPATSGSAVLKGNGSGGFTSAVSGTDFAPATSGAAILKGNGAGGFASASSGTDYQAPISSTTPVSHQFLTGFTAPNTFAQAQPASADLSDSANIDLLNTAQTFTAAKINSVAGASSTPAMLYSGAPYAAGNATTNRPQWLMEWGSPTANTWNPNGTAIGVNSASGFTGKLLDLKINGSSVFSVDYGNGTSANQGSGVFFRNLNDNAQSFNICGQTGTVQASANCLSFYQSNAGTFALYSLAAAQGIYKIFNTNNTYATFAVGGATAASGYTYQMIVQNQAAAAYNAAVTMAVRAASGQTGDLQRWESNTPATLAKVDVNGKGFFANLNSAGITVAGLGRWDASGNLVSSSELSGDVTTSGSNVTTIANGAVTNAKLANSSVTVNGTPCTLGSSCSPSATPTIASYSGTMVGAGGGWTNGSSVSYADFAAATTSNTLTQIVSNNITCTAKTDKTPAIDCTLPATGYYMVCASGTGTSNGSNAAYFRLTDNAGTPVIINGGQEANLATTQGGPFSLCGMYNAASTSVTFKLQGAATAGNASVLQDTLRPITWMVKQ